MLMPPPAIQRPTKEQLIAIECLFYILGFVLFAKLPHLWNKAASDEAQVFKYLGNTLGA